jgi:molecular chaperone GrpE (heat shock protein)
MNISIPGLRLISARKLHQFRQEAAEASAQTAAARAELAQVREECATRTAELTQLLRDASRASAGAGAAGGGAPPPVARELIGVADRLVDLTGAGAPQDGEQVGAALRWMRSRTEALLSACDVVRIEDGGPVDFQRHEVLGNRAAPNDDLLDHIADTVRPGYAWHGSVLRPQQVIAYVESDEATGTG